MVYAINEINENPELLPNITLGFRIYDTCYKEIQSIEGAFQILSGTRKAIPNYLCENNYKLVGVIGDLQSSSSVAVARILGLYRFPQILQYVKRVKFTNSAGQKLSYNDDGDQQYELMFVNWQAIENGTTRYASFASLRENPESGIIRSPISWCYVGPDAILELDRTCTLVLQDGDAQWITKEIFQVPRSICSDSCLPGYRKAAQEGQPVCCFDCILCSEDEFNNETDSTSCLKCPEDMWANEEHNGCWLRSLEFLSYEESLGGTLAALSIGGSLLTLSILVIFLKNSETAIVKANNRNLSYLLLLALFLCYLCSLMFIGHPLNLTCILRQITFGISFVLCISCVLGKTIMVVIAFNSTQPRSSSRMWLNSRVPNILVLACTAIQVIICTGWIVHSPPFKNIDKTSKLGTIIVECNEGSQTAFWCMMGYMGFLASLSLAIAYLARKLPGSFNEAKLITFSMLIFGAVWISFIPAYLSTRGKYMVAVEIFAIFSSSSGLLGSIFLPKCYIIILRPDRNNKEFLTRKKITNIIKHHY
ncbi:vomeronasal type-2 receptor 26-like [Rhinophrynus dorsalis]